MLSIQFGGRRRLWISSIACTHYVKYYIDMKTAFTYNQNGVKSSCDMYRNIKGVHYTQWTSNPSEFAKEKQIAKEKGLKTKIIKGELFVEKR